MCGCLSCCPYWGPGPEPRHVPWSGIELATLVHSLVLNPLSYTSQGWFAFWTSIKPKADYMNVKREIFIMLSAQSHIKRAKKKIFYFDLSLGQLIAGRENQGICLTFLDKSKNKIHWNISIIALHRYFSITLFCVQSTHVLNTITH